MKKVQPTSSLPWLPLLTMACSSHLPDRPPSDAGARVTSPAVVTQHNDNNRTGANLRETALSPKTVTQQSFGLLYSRQVRGFIYAQPLFVPDLDIAGRRRDVAFVVTQHNEVYAFDASDPAASEPLWHIQVGPPVVSQHLDAYQGSPYRDIIPELGITSTPVIDLDSGTLYLYAQTEVNSEFFNHLHALDIRSGVERSGSPKLVVVSGKGTAAAGSNGVITTDQVFLLQRPGLALDRDTLWIAGGGHGDFGPYHGWILAWDKATLEVRGTYLSTPDGNWGGIWQSGNGIAIDEQGAGYFMTGNGAFDDATDPPNVSNSFGKVKLDANGLTLVDWFTPFNQFGLNAIDGDLGSSGPLLLPGTQVVVGGGKEGKVYVLDRGSLGHIHEGDDSQIRQSFQATFGTVDQHIHAGPVYWDGPTGPRIYILSETDKIRGYRFVGNRFETEAFSSSAVSMPPGTPGGAMSLSANGGEAGSGILWALTQADDNQLGAITGRAALYAFDAEDLTHVLYSSLDDPGGMVGDYVKFSVPTVTAGRVFVGTASGRLLVYGLKP